MLLVLLGRNVLEVYRNSNLGLHTEIRKQCMSCIYSIFFTCNAGLNTFSKYLGVFFKMGDLKKLHTEGVKVLGAITVT